MKAIRLVLALTDLFEVTGNAPERAVEVDSGQRASFPAAHIAGNRCK